MGESEGEKEVERSECTLEVTPETCANLFLKIPPNGEMAQQSKALAALPDGPAFSSQQPHGPSQLSVTPSPGNLTPSHQYTHKENLDKLLFKIPPNANVLVLISNIF